MRRNFSALIVLAIPTIAEAHGEEVLGSIFAEVVTVATLFALLTIVPALKRYSGAGFVGCLIGVLISWATIGDIPYRKNANFITIVLIAFPIVSTVLVLLLDKLFASKRGA
ncbi:hypothetical protein [Hydrogenophaga sp. MI9]|uniref:hypothetical protein n=1 Tax=Hydrogenophaga sp. MI9 TaxID=3453719 RepID=UPI003EE84895